MIGLAVAWIAVGCSDSPMGVEDYASLEDQWRIAAAIVTPLEVQLAPGDTARFRVNFTDATGKPIKGPVLWSATGGSINRNGSEGEYVAGDEAGLFRVIARAPATGVEDTAAVRITKPEEPENPSGDDSDGGGGDDSDEGNDDESGGSDDETPAVASVSVSPSQASLAPGESTVFAARLRDDQGNLMDGSVTWSATGGTIDGSGRYVAGSRTGDFRVVARAVDGGAEGSASVRIASVNGVSIRPGESIQQAVNAHPAGTTFVIRSGRHVRQSVAPKDGNVFIGEDGAILDGDLATAFAFRGGARNVTLRNLEITRYRAWDDRQGALNLWDARGWRLENLNVHHNLVDGVNGWGEITIVGGSYSWNGRTGLSISQGTNIVLDGVELANNHHDGRFRALWHAGGIKMARVRNVTIRNSRVHGNNGPGIWCDIDCRDVQIVGNRVERNGYAGIFYEISTRALISGNTVRENGFSAGSGYHGSGILVASSSDVRVTGNTLRGNRDGIVGLQKQRGGYSVSGLRVLENDIRGTARASGLVDRDGNGAVFSSDNRFDRNRYSSLTNRPFWGRGGLRTVTEWRSSGQDLGSTFD